MIISIIKYFRGYVRIQLSGLEIERFINLCGRKDILLWDLREVNHKIYCNISIQGFYDLKDIAKKTRTKIKIIQKRGFPFHIFHYRKKKVFFLCFFAAIILLKIASLYVWKIEVLGNTSIYKNEVIDVLEKEGCMYGTKISTIPVEDLETKIRSAFPDIIWTSIDITGTCVTVYVKENLLIPEKELPETFEENTGYDLVADADGKIASIVTRNGTPQVKVDSKVKKGDILVLGQLPIYNDALEVSQYLPCIADADIMLEQNISYKNDFSMTYEKKTYLDKQITLYYFEIMDFPPVIWRKYLINHQYDETLEKKQICLWNNFYLPAYVTKNTMKNYRIEQLCYTKEEAISRANDLFTQYIEKLQQKGIQIVDKNVMINFDKNKCVINGKLVTQKKITTYSKSKQKEIANEGINENESR